MPHMPPCKFLHFTRILTFLKFTCLRCAGFEQMAALCHSRHNRRVYSFFKRFTKLLSYDYKLRMQTLREQGFSGKAIVAKKDGS